MAALTLDCRKFGAASSYSPCASSLPLLYPRQLLPPPGSLALVCGVALLVHHAPSPPEECRWWLAARRFARLVDDGGRLCARLLDDGGHDAAHELVLLSSWRKPSPCGPLRRLALMGTSAPSSSVSLAPAPSPSSSTVPLLQRQDVSTAGGASSTGRRGTTRRTMDAGQQ